VSVVANVAINVDARNAIQRLQQVQQEAKTTERAVNGLGAVVGRLAGAFAAFQAAKFVFVQAAEVESQRRSLEVLTGSAQRAGQIVKELQDLGAVTPFTSTELIESAKRLQAFGVEASKVVDTTRRLADVSGATGAELQGLVTAYGQVQAKGRLQGEELLQFQERGVALQKVLKEEYKLSGEEFQKALEGGRISAEAVEAAIIKLTDAGGKYANGAIAQSDTLNGKLSTLQDSFQRLAQNIGTFFEPVFKFLIDGVNAFLERVNNASRLQAEASSQVEANRRTRTRFGALRFANPFDQEVQQYRERLRKSLLASELGGSTGPSVARGSATGGLPPLLAASGGKGRKAGKSDAEREAERAAEVERRLQERLRGLQIESQLTQKLLSNKLLIADVENLGNKEAAIGLKAESQTLQIVADLQKSLIGVTDQRERLAIITKTAAELDNLNVETLIELERNRLAVIKEQNAEFFKRAGLNLQDNLRGGAGAFDLGLPDLRVSEGETRIAELRQQLQELASPINVALNGANAIGDAFSTAFTDVITGAKSAQQALSEVFKKIADAFIEAATQIIAKQIALITFQSILNALGGGGGGFSFGGAGPVSGASVFGAGQAGFNPSAFGGASFFADGGFVTGPTNAVIGEGGESEYVIPASKMNAAMARYSKGVRGEAVVGGEGGSAQAAAVSAGPMEPIDVRYSVERINSVEYVTNDQFQRGLAQAAQQGAVQGERRALRTLSNSPANRRRIGL
jgi:tape measure domain-containing protein